MSIDMAKENRMVGEDIISENSQIINLSKRNFKKALIRLSSHLPLY